MTKREQTKTISKQPKASVKWAPFLPNGTVYVADKYGSKRRPDLTCGFTPVRVHIAPTATHAVVELAKVEAVLSRLSTSQPGVDLAVSCMMELGFVRASTFTKKPAPPTVYEAMQSAIRDLMSGPKLPEPRKPKRRSKP